MKAAHIDEMLQDTEEEHAVFTIKSTGTAEYSDGKKQILLRFRETYLELGLNKGNSVALAELFDSTESDDWIGKRVALHTEQVRNSMAPGGFSQAIRVSVKQTAKANRPKPAGKPAPAMTQEEVDEGDDIPFDGESDVWPKGRQ